ncbi:MAG: isoprenylcysteine carboxylmethyltransferase family protein [Nannocystaceae bacterium]|nr:isoprenylcysteine carboxylmethyltransferase family protein [bacterium]
MTAPVAPRGAGWVLVALGLVLVGGVALALRSAGALGFFIAGIAAFHLLEFVSVALWRREQLSMASFAFSGRAYFVAIGLGLAEYGVRSSLVGPFEGVANVLQYVGIGLMLVGGVTRIWAMRTAGRFFNHFVQSELGEEHQLVEGGPYRWLRHPSYFGFYWFSIGTQLLLANPLTLLLYFIALGAFFSRRIAVEEAALERRFGDAYCRYRDARSLGFPA